MTDETSQTRPSAFDIIRQGLAMTPEFRRVIWAMIGAGVLLGLGRISVPILFQRIIDQGLLTEDGIDRSTLYRLAAITAAVVVVVSAMSLITELVMVRVAERALANLRTVVLRRALDLSLAEHGQARQGDLVSRTTGDLETLTKFLDWGAWSWLVASTIALTAAIAMLVYSWLLAIVALITMAAMIPLLRAIQRRQQVGYGVVRDRTGDLLGDSTEVISGAEVVRAFGRQQDAIARIDTDIDAAYEAQVRVNRPSSLLFTISDVFGTLAVSAVLLVVVWLGVADAPELGTVVAMLFLIQIILTPVAELTEVIDQTSLALAGWNRAIELASRPQALPDPTDPVPVPHGPLSVELDQVTFAYDEHTVISEVSVSIAPGTAVALVGSTGSGKTTLARLLCRLADPVEGAVRLGGVDLRNMSGPDRRRAVRMVPQDGFLFATTVLDNILRGRAGATRADAEAAIETLGLGDWIAGLPQGLDTQVAAGGDGLSVGERQLVAIVRAALADPGLLILDEATSSLDPSTELAMSRALEHIQRGRTTVTVAHRLSTAERADLVVLLDHGRLLEVGSHQELMSKGGAYAALHAAWTRGVAT
ncbi:MAG: ABC transporter ATP-binding protein [Acidimicrobiales bacterium]|nr:ABC transporter ATP-binding protein [Acidimicrobiales bacterium]